jgi:TusA-related sulfurtransferase
MKDKFALPSKDADYFVDITKEVCPFTFVRTKLQLERMAPGEVVEIRLNAGEPLDNVPRAAAEDGHHVLSLGPEDEAAPHGVHRLRIQKG